MIKLGGKTLCHLDHLIGVGFAEITSIEHGDGKSGGLLRIFL